MPKRALYGYKSDCTIRFPRKTPFLAFFGENAPGQSDRSILKLCYLVNHQADFSDFLQRVRGPEVEKCEKQFSGQNNLWGQNGPFFTSVSSFILRSVRPSVCQKSS